MAADGFAANLTPVVLAIRKAGATAPRRFDATAVLVQALASFQAAAVRETGKELLSVRVPEALSD